MDDPVAMMQVIVAVLVMNITALIIIHIIEFKNENR